MLNKTLRIAFVLAVATCIFMHTNMVKAQDLEEVLVGYWTFDEADIDGDTAKNFKGDKDGTITGAQTVEGKIGDALEFDGVGNFVLFDNPEPMPEALTIMAWASATDWGETGRRNIIDSITGGMWYRLGFQSTVPGGNLEFVCDTGDDVGGREMAIADLSGLDGWHHIAGVRDFDKKVLLIYVDGSEVSKIGFNFSTPITPEVLVVGAGHRGTIEHWSGSIDEVAIFNVALSEGDIKNFMESGLAALSVSQAGKLTSMWGYIKDQ